MSYLRNKPEEYYRGLIPQTFYNELKDYIKNLSTVFDFREEPNVLEDVLEDEIMSYFKEMYNSMKKVGVGILGATHNKDKSIEEILECSSHDECILKERFVMLAHDMMFPRINMLLLEINQVYKLSLNISMFTMMVSAEYLNSEEALHTAIVRNHYYRLVDSFHKQTGSYYDTLAVIEGIAEAMSGSPEGDVLNRLFHQN